MPLDQATIDRRLTQFERDLDRAEELYSRLALRGYSLRPSDRSPRALRQTDRRDAAQFIFFEAAAKFEELAQDLLRFEIRLRFGVSPARADFLMGHPEHGSSRLMGWGSVSTLCKRAANLLGKTGFVARLEERVGSKTHSRLVLAHTLRNRLAHNTGDARKSYRKALARLNVPQASRQGTSVGRILMEYPASVSPADCWFHRLLKAYRAVAEKAGRSLRA